MSSVQVFDLLQVKASLQWISSNALDFSIRVSQTLPLHGGSRYRSHTISQRERKHHEVDSTYIA
jgi:hypothetical protein